MNDTPQEPEPDSPRTRARTKKIPRLLQSPDGSIIHLTGKQRGIIRRLPTADNFISIADEMRCSPSLVTQTYKLPAVQEYLRGQMEAAGITHGLLMGRLREGIDATKEGKGTIIDKDSGTIKADQVVDYGERREHVKLALRLQGLDTPAPDGGDTVTNNSIYNIVIQAREKRGLDK